MKVVIFYDYPCPFCKTSLEDLVALRKDFPQLEIDYCPVELNPRPDRRSFGVELLYFLKDTRGQVEVYNQAVYDGVFLEGRPPWSQELALEAVAKAERNVTAGKQALENSTYTPQVLKHNKLAYETYGLDAVPAYISGNNKLKAILGVGVAKETLRDFFVSLEKKADQF